MQGEHLALREHHRLVVERAVLEAEHEARIHAALGADDLQQVALRQQVAGGRAEGQKAVGDAFRVAHRHRPGQGVRSDGREGQDETKPDQQTSDAMCARFA